MDEIVWEEPPGPKFAVKGKWGVLLGPLRERPGEWARIPGKHNTSASHNIRRGAFNGVNRGDYEAVIRNTVSGSGDLYVRYVGHEKVEVQG